MKYLPWLLGALFLFQGHALAEEVWINFGESPYTGDLEKACDLHGLPDWRCTMAKNMLAGGHCVPGWLENNERIDVTFTRDGEHHVMQNAVTRFSMAATDPRRATYECHVGGGVWWIVPTCGNDSIQRRKVTGSGNGREPLKPWQADPRPPQFVPGITLKTGCCCCDTGYTHFPSVLVPGGTSLESGSGYTAPRANQ